MKTVACIFTILFFLLWAGADVPAGERVRLANGEWPPYTSKDLPHYGLLSQITTEAFGLEGVDVEYRFFNSWKRCYILAKKGQFDGSLTWIPTRERKKDFYFCDPAIPHENVLFHLKTLKFDWHTIEDLKPYRISITSSYSYGNEFDTAVKEGKLNTFIVYKDIVNFQNLLQGRIDIFPMDKKVGYALLVRAFSREDQARVTNHAKPLKTTFPTVIISKQIDNGRAGYLVSVFNNGLSQLRKSGRYQKIISLHQP